MEITFKRPPKKAPGTTAYQLQILERDGENILITVSHEFNQLRQQSLPGKKGTTPLLLVN